MSVSKKTLHNTRASGVQSSSNDQRDQFADQSFDDRAAHLQQNIYNSDKGRLRLLILQRDLQALVDNQTTLSVLDAGCGSGYMSEWVASYGHRLLACDSAQVMVAATRQRLAVYPKAVCQQQTIQELPESPTYHLVMCHAVLEWVAEQDVLLQKLRRLVAPGGYLSLMFYNAWARELSQLIYGNFDYIDKNYQVRQRVKLSPHWPVFPDVIEKQLQTLGFKVVGRSGIRVFYDIIRNKEHYQQFAEDIIRHELKVSQRYPFWQMGRYIHLLLKSH